MPTVTGTNAAANAHRFSCENRRCLRLSIKIRTIEKHIAGVTISISIQNRGVADQSCLKPLVAYQTPTLAAQPNEQMSSATDNADEETCL